MAKVSVIIPARKEPYLRETLRDLYANRAGEIETIVVLDGWEPEFPIPEYPELKILRNRTAQGMRPCVNAAAKAASGKYLMKMDAHCSIGEGWDAILKADCEDNWIVVPRRYWWDAPNWKPLIDQHGNIGYVEAMSYRYPHRRPYDPYLTTRPDPARAERRKDIEIDEDMGCQGSLWFMQAAHFKRLGGMSSYGYGTFSSEPEEINLKTQLGPWQGKVMRNKKTWYAHWAKPNSHWLAAPEAAGRVTDEERRRGNLYCYDFWFNNRWSERVHDFEWLVEKFWPLPDWPEDWRWLVTQYDRYEMPKVVPNG